MQIVQKRKSLTGGYPFRLRCKLTPSLYHKGGTPVNYRTLVSTAAITHDEWLQYRTKSIGGSDSAAIAGHNPWRSSIAVWLEKTGRETETIDNERMRIGRDLEDYVARRFEEATGLKVRRKNAILQHQTIDWMTANVDRLIVGADEGLECKVTGSYSSNDWKDDKIPLMYEMQIHHYMAVTGASAWWIAALIGNERLAIKRIQRDEEVISALIDIEKSFWEGNVLTDEMPAPDGSEAAGEAIKKLWPDASDGVEVVLDSDFEELIKRRDDLNKLGNEIDEELHEIDQTIQVAMRDAEVARVGERKVTWKNRAMRRLDAKKLEAEQPEVYGKYVKESNSRVFIVK
jgi:putative phage-type endonuclease